MGKQTVIVLWLSAKSSDLHQRAINNRAEITQVIETQVGGHFYGFVAIGMVKFAQSENVGKQREPASIEAKCRT